MKPRSCLYWSKRYVYKLNGKEIDRDMKVYCWVKPGKRRTLNVCRNCLIASATRWDEKRTVRVTKPRWATE